MTDDLVKRLWLIGTRTGVTNRMKDAVAAREAADRIEKLEMTARGVPIRDMTALSKALDRIKKLEAALRNIAEGDIPRTVKIPFRDDGQSSKHDRCEHGKWFYEDCGCCIEDYARKALEP